MFGTRIVTREKRPAPLRADLPVLVVVAFVAAAAPAGVLAIRHALPFQAADDDGRTIEIAVSDRRLTVPERWAPAPETMRSSGRASLRVPLSDIVGPAADPRAVVAVTLTRADDAMAPSERPRALYARFLSAEASTAPGGLIRRRFREGTPYEGEALLIAPPHGRAFSARCPEARSGSVEPTCFAEFRHADLDAQVQIPLRDIEQWERVASFVRTLALSAPGR